MLARRLRMVYTDKTHLVADTVPELHRFAKSIGLKREWFQDHSRHPHYDLTTARAAKRAAQNGAVVVSQRRIVKVACGLTSGSSRPLASAQTEMDLKDRGG